MRLRTRFVLVLAAFVFVIIILSTALAWAMMAHIAVEADEESARALLNRGLSVLSDDREALLGTAADWGSWDDTYRFMSDRHSEYIDSNFVDSTLDTLRLDVLALFDTAGEAVTVVSSDRPGEHGATPPSGLCDAMRASAGAADRLGEPSGAAGFLLDRNELWLVAAVPILTSEDKGPSRGRLLMARRIDGDERDRWTALIHPSLNIARAARAWAPGTVNVQPVSRHSLLATTAVADIFGTGRILLELAVPRRAFGHMSVNLYYLAGWIVVCGVALTVFSFWILNRWVLRSVTQSTAAIRASLESARAGDASLPRLTKLHEDEIGDFVDAANAVMASYETAHREAQQRRDEAQQAQKLAGLGTMVAGMAHEINNPNSVIDLNMRTLDHRIRQLSGHLEALPSAAPETVSGLVTDAREATDEAAEIVRETVAASRRISGFVSSLKRFASPVDEGPRERVDIADVVDQAVRWVRHEVKKKRCRLECNVADEVPPVTARREEIVQVLINLLHNACGASERPGLRIGVEAERSCDGVEIRVTDEGVGIAEEDIERVMDPFFSTRQAEGGTGLGLSISAAIVQSHGGTLRIRSAPGRGTVVTVRLPAEEERSHEV